MSTLGCEYGCEDIHEADCPESPLDMTKQQFIDAAEGGTRAAFESLKIIVSTGVAVPDAIEMAIEESRESAVCFVELCRH